MLADVVVAAALDDVDPGGDVFDPGRLVALLVEDLPGRLEDLVPAGHVEGALGALRPSAPVAASTSGCATTQATLPVAPEVWAFCPSADAPRALTFLPGRVINLTVV